MSSGAPSLRSRLTGAAGLALAATLALTACSSGGSITPADPSSSASATASALPTGSITVLAAASLSGAFTLIGTNFESKYPGSKVTFSFGGSSDLATQITSGAPADVFASASPTNMDTVTQAGLADLPVTNFASNSGEIAVPPDNPGNVTSLADLAKSDVTVAVCQPQVPCGKLATTIFANADITVTPVTQETDVKSTLSKVSTGAVDAGLVYVTDVKAAGSSVKGIEIPAEDNATTAYPIASLKDSQNSALAQAFVAYVLSAAGLQVLSDAGFASP